MYATLSTTIGSKTNAVLNAANTGWVTISSSPGIAKQKDIVSKSGRTTGVTTGVVSQTGVTIKVWYTSSEYAWFQDQIVIYNLGAPFCAAGDSGSVIYNSHNQFVGLLFAASSNSRGVTVATIANTADRVMRGLQLQTI